MPASLTQIEKQFDQKLSSVSTPDQIEALRIHYLGRKGIFNTLFDKIKELPESQKQSFGQKINALKNKIQDKISQKKTEFENNVFEASLKSKKEDLTLPAIPFILGKAHPITKVLEEITKLFASLGFSVEEGPQIETEQNNFNKLNIPEDHPSRDLHDTFYIRSSPSSPEPSQADHFLLRTHTSPVQVRVMQNRKPPIRMIAPGKVYRHEAIDATHSSVFHQVEGLVVDQDISFADLKGTLEIFSRLFFGDKIKTRFRPSYFPFVEPGAEMDINCSICQGTDGHCPVCKGGGWLEILGAGMVHPNVFKGMGYDPNQVSGFAFGMGIERMIMIRYGIRDMRLFYENHIDFLKQF
jgi:phenylalanyl-tRNA synthetase alpha chain